MEIINNEALFKITGGAAFKTIAAGIAIIGVFIIGLVDGLLRPLKCNR